MHALVRGNRSTRGVIGTEILNVYTSVVIGSLFARTSLMMSYTGIHLAFLLDGIVVTHSRPMTLVNCQSWAQRDGHTCLHRDIVLAFPIIASSAPRTSLVHTPIDNTFLRVRIMCTLRATDAHRSVVRVLMAVIKDTLLFMEMALGIGATRILIIVIDTRIANACAIEGKTALLDIATSVAVQTVARVPYTVGPSGEALARWSVVFIPCAGDPFFALFLVRKVTTDIGTADVSHVRAPSATAKAESAFRLGQLGAGFFGALASRL